MDYHGWPRRLMTSKSISISINGKRNVGDTGKDHIASKAFADGRDFEAMSNGKPKVTPFLSA